MVWYLWQGWYYFFIHTPCQFPLRFIIIVNKYTGTTVLVCMTACGIATFVCVEHGLLCCDMERANRIVVLLPQVQPVVANSSRHMCGCTAVD